MRKPVTTNRAFDFSRLVGQFLLGGADAFVPQGWDEERIGGWVLGSHPSLPRIRLFGADGGERGWLLGYPIGKDGLLLSEGDTLTVPEDSDPAGSGVEEFVYGFGGKFVAALVGGRHPRLYLDPCGSMSVVYCPHKEIVASTPNLIPHDNRTRCRLELARALGIPHTNAMYPLVLTPRHNIHRLLPNHYLDLSHWQDVRHWPKKPLKSRGSIEETVTSITAITKRNIAAVVNRTPAYLRLTAGQDSRMLLACARDMTDRLELLTVPMPDDGAFVDVDTAERIAQRFCLRHFVPQMAPPKQEDLDAWMFRIGYSTGELRGWQAATMFRQANPAYAQLDGGIGGLERIGDVLRPGETMHTEITPERLLERCLAPRTAQTLSVFRRWLSTAPADNAVQILDLFEIEQRLGCWGGVWPYAETPDAGFLLFPMCHREIIERMITLPLDYRLACALMRDVIEREWPELLEWPFNKPVGATHASLLARRMWSNVKYRTDLLACKVMQNGNLARGTEIALPFLFWTESL
ncbi:MAG: hypothetical protein FIA93_06920 [Deltaproteobacteria bacterium]|nr:hypothetical protein [Deltaproteobacteria bacterium]